MTYESNIEITMELVHKIITGRIEKFLDSDADEKHKRFMEKVDIVPFLNNRFKNSFYGFANILPDTEYVRKKYHIEDDTKTIKFENNRCFTVLELCPYMINTGPRQPLTELRETIAHELAHIMEMRIYGFENRKVRFHGPKWQEFAKCFGCTELKFDD